MSVKTLLVDVGGVLLNENPDFWDLLRREFHAPVNVEALFFGPGSPWPECRTGALDYSEYMRRVAEQLGMDPGLLAELADRHEWMLNQPMAEWTRGVRRRGLEVILVSNADLTLEARLRSFGLDDVFDAVVNSARVGAAKPDPDIYRRALELTASSPSECLFVDDREKNCAAARELGMEALVFVDTEQFVQEVRRRHAGEVWVGPGAR